MVVDNGPVGRRDAGRRRQRPSVGYGEALGADTVYWLYRLVLRRHWAQGIVTGSQDSRNLMTGLNLEAKI